jgi:hypothetical protein
LGISFFAKESTRWGKSVQEALGGSKEASQKFLTLSEIYKTIGDIMMLSVLLMLNKNDVK